MWKGIEQSNGINRIAISPYQEFIIYITQDGSILFLKHLKKLDWQKG